MDKIYYIDPENGSSSADGLSPETAVSSPRCISPEAGDTILLKRGTTFRGAIFSPNGTPDAPIVWSAYGEGELPIVSGSVDFSDAEKWKNVRENIWEAVGLPMDEVCNIIFNGGESFGTLRWNEEDLCGDGDFIFSHFGVSGKIPAGETPRLLVYSHDNPGVLYDSIELAVFGSRCVAQAVHDVVFSDIAFINSGVHGFATANAARISILRCRFENIGGCVWSKKLKIRFGNGVEFWDKAMDSRVEDCVFNEIYDSCTTHQGARTTPPMRITIRGNKFRNYGMAAFELRELIPIDTIFSDNVCEGAGVGFAMQGDLHPRRSEIFPQPMGHHIFAWKIPHATERGSMWVERNYFGSAPEGSAEYSIIAPEAEDQIHFSDNFYETGRPERDLFRYGKYTIGEN